MRKETSETGSIGVAIGGVKEEFRCVFSGGITLESWGGDLQYRKKRRNKKEDMWVLKDRYT